eukprot:COSAG02_NODE_502_length_21039_cov_62.499045_24_plen_113_part_00
MYRNHLSYTRRSDSLGFRVVGKDLLQQAFKLSHLVLHFLHAVYHLFHLCCMLALLFLVLLLCQLQLLSWFSQVAPSAAVCLLLLLLLTSPTEAQFRYCDGLVKVPAVAVEAL